jgi:fatty-acyl-CoA synthase
MLGYWDEDERTAEAIDRGRWIHTGDVAVMDDEAYLRIVGRSKDMVIRSGENVYPPEIEEFLHAHPDIADVRVIGVPGARYVEEIMAARPASGALLGHRVAEEPGLLCVYGREDVGSAAIRGDPAGQIEESTGTVQL